MMRLLGILLGISLALALLQAVAQVLALVLVVGALVTFATKPRETIALVTTLGVLNLVALFPLPALGIAGGLLACRVLSRTRIRVNWRRRRREEQIHRLTEGSLSRSDQERPAGLPDGR